MTVLAGDIGIGLAGLQWALTIERPVVYVMGNHEFYGQRPLVALWRKAREKVAGTHVHLLENESLVLDDPSNPGARVRFLGATLWTDFAILGDDRQEAMMDYAQQVMSDYRAIYVARRGKALPEYGMSGSRQGDRLTPDRTLCWHKESRDFLEREFHCIDDGDSWARTVVVTHHAPSILSLAERRVAAKIDAAYASNLGPLVSQADLWVHGHTHVRADYRVGAGRVVSNPRGYMGDTPVENFNPTLAVEV